MFSARRVLTPPQRRVLLALVAIVVAGVLAAPQAASVLAFAALAILYGVNIALRLALYAAGWSGHGVRGTDHAALLDIRDADLPIYTVLVPLFGEAHMVRRVVHALTCLDYPRAKLDIKLIFEECDPQTIAAARSLKLDACFEILVVPDGQPRTKPRACNYALNFARGQFVVIFDAEDRPEPDQLKKAVLAFRSMPDTACFQARLAFYNGEQNWLARMFALEYAGWFAIMLPGLTRLGVPIPLGGTSNHFRTNVLRTAGAWDAHNVTEDADLGLRLARLGHAVAPLDSTTLEEANACLASWVRQRSRWLKGYMQTTLVHLREPVTFARAVGTWRYLACLTFIGGAVATALISPVLWLLALVWWFAGGGPQGEVYDFLFAVSIFFGNGLLAVLAMLAAHKSGERRVLLCGATFGAYGLLASAGAYRGMWQLINGRSSFWEKTEHGLDWCGRTRLRLSLVPRHAVVHAMLALLFVVLSACAALANPWLRGEGQGEAVTTVRVVRSADGFAADGTTVAALEVRAEWGATDRLTLIADAETKTIGAVDDAVLERGRIGARVQMLKWDGGILSVEGMAGTGAVRAGDGESFFASPHFSGEIRVLAGQDFTLFGDHAWAGVELGWRWRGGPPADEGIIDGIIGWQPRDDLLVMAQYFGVVSGDDAFDGYRPYNSGKLQLSVAYEAVRGVWLQAGGIASLHGDDSGAAGGMVALWWRF